MCVINTYINIYIYRYTSILSKDEYAYFFKPDSRHTLAVGFC